MFVIREIFHLQFGRYREARALVDEALRKNLMLQPPGHRLLTDFSGEGYRLIIELPYPSLADYEKALDNEIRRNGWKEWYEQFKPFVRFSEREILRVC
jgi:hypothetical protein